MPQETMTTRPSIPDCGAYLVWPCEGMDWIHPEDVEQAEKWIPSTRVFRRRSFDSEYYFPPKCDAWPQVQPQKMPSRIPPLSLFYFYQSNVGIMHQSSGLQCQAGVLERHS